MKREEWETVRLGDVFDLQMGKTPARDVLEYWNNGDNKWVSISDLSTYSKYVGETRETISNLGVEKSGIKIVPSNTVIMSFKLSIGKTAITTEEIYTNEAIMAFIPKGAVVYNSAYLYYLLSGVKWDKGVSKAVKGKTLNKQSISNYSVPLPPLDIQRQIADVLDKVTELIDLRKKQLEKLDELVKARFVELTVSTDTVQTRMGDIATYLNGYAFKPVQWEDSGYPIIRIQNLNNENAPYNYYSGKLPDKYLIHNGDVLVSWATHLEAYIWKGEEAWLNQHIFKVVFDKIEVDKTYFVYACEEALRQAFRNAHGFKPTMEHIKKADFDSAVVQLPNIQTQKKFSTFVEQTNKAKAPIQQSLETLETLKKSLMQEYFG